MRATLAACAAWNEKNSSARTFSHTLKARQEIEILSLECSAARFERFEGRWINGRALIPASLVQGRAIELEICSTLHYPVMRGSARRCTG